MVTKTQFDAETVIADFIGDLADHNQRLAPDEPNDYVHLRALARILISDLKENRLGIVTI